MSMPSTAPLAVPATLSEEALARPSPTRRHEVFFFEDGNTAIQCEDVLFNIYRGTLTSRMEPWQDMFAIPSGDHAKEGTPDNPIFLAFVSASDFAALCYFLYNVEQYWAYTKTPGEHYLGLLRLAALYEFPAGVAYAKRRIDHDVRMDAYTKLTLGIEHNERKWVETSLDLLFISGANMADPSPTQALALGRHVWTIAKGCQLMATTTRELITTPPRMLVGSADAAEWSHSRCDQHKECIAGVASQWKQIAAKLGGSFNSFSLQIDLGGALRDFKFKKMDPRCRDALIKELTDRADVFHTRIIQAIADKLLLPLPTTSTST